jgi:RNA 2',3'-cyclic 3'-phosphodiesterase
MLRLFVALDLPATIKADLTSLVGNLPDTRWADDDQLHLTLRFIGEVDGGTARDIMEALATVPARPIELLLKGVGHFPPRGEPKVLWVGVERSEELVAFKRRIDSALRDTGLAAEGRKFSPHVTIARFRQPPPYNRFAAYLARHSLYRSAPFWVSDFALYSSWLRPEGALHRLEARYELVPGIDEGEAW